MKGRELSREKRDRRLRINRKMIMKEKTNPWGRINQ